MFHNKHENCIRPPESEVQLKYCSVHNWCKFSQGGRRVWPPLTVPFLKTGTTTIVCHSRDTVPELHMMLYNCLPGQPYNIQNLKMRQSHPAQGPSPQRAFKLTVMVKLSPSPQTLLPLQKIRRTSNHFSHCLTKSSFEVSTPSLLYTVWAGNCLLILSHLGVCQNHFEANWTSCSKWISVSTTFHLG